MVIGGQAVWATISPIRPYYPAARSSPSRTSVRTATPVPPDPVNPQPPPVLNAGPAMSRWAHGMRSSESVLRADELAQEHAGQEHAGHGHPELGVREVGDVRLQQGLEIAGERHRPHGLVDVVRGGAHPLDQRVVAHQPRDAVPERDDLRAGQGGDVDDRVGLLVARGGERVGHHEPALRVGVQHLDGRAAVDPEHVVRADRGAGRHVLGEAEPARHPHRHLRVRRAPRSPTARPRLRPCRSSCRPSTRRA